MSYVRGADIDIEIVKFMDTNSKTIFIRSPNRNEYQINNKFNKIYFLFFFFVGPSIFFYHPTMVERIYLDNHIRKLHIRYMLCVRIYVTAGQYLMETISELIYTPKTERDYGTLACWGKNSIGKQSDPCLFQVVPAGKYAQTHIRINMRKFIYLFY